MSLTMRTLCVLTAGFLLAAAMPVQAQETLEPGIYNPTTDPTPTRMYFHINGFQDFPINTQKPSDDYAASAGLGLATHSGCVKDPTPLETHFTDQSHHTYYGYSSPGYVQYDVDENGEPRYHPERGISFDVDLDASVQPVLTWVLESQVFAGNADPDPNQLPVPVPNVIVRGTVREGDEISVGHSALNKGEIIAQGQSAPITLNGPNTDGQGFVEYFQDGNKHIYKFTVPLDYNRPTVDAEESYNLRVDVFMDNELCAEPGADGADYAMLDFVRVHTSPKYRPSLDWTVLNPLRIEYLHPQFIADDLVIHTSTNSPWGNYDVRGDLPSEQGGGLEVQIEGPSAAINLERVALTARTHEHDHHTEAVDATWIWNYQADNAKNGEYTIVFKAKNDQETADAMAVAKFEIGTGKITGCGNQATGESATCEESQQLDGKAKANEESPGLPVVALLGALAAIGIARRRRD